MGAIAARDARDIVELAQNLLAIHLIAIAQALDLRGLADAGPRTKAAHELLRKHVAFLDGDRRLDRDIARTVDLIRSGELLQFRV